MEREEADKLLHDKVEAGETVSPVLPDGIKNYLIDIDGTITEDVPNEEPERMSTCKPWLDARKIINQWYDEGHIITFFTSRTDETREITEYCDKSKWDSIWYTEHHFNHEGMESLTNPLMMGVDAAARTKNIRIGLF